MDKVDEDEDSPPGSPVGPVPDNSNIRDEAVEDLPLNLVEYLEQQDNPEPVYRPPLPRIPTAAEAADPELAPRFLSPEPPRTPSGPGDHVHRHGLECPIYWNPPTMKPIFRKREVRSRLEGAGILNFIKFNFPRVPIMFVEREWKHITWSEERKSIVVAPQLAGAPATVINVEYLQRLWPGLPSKASHSCPLVPDLHDRHFMREAVGRYFAVEATHEFNGWYPILHLEPCFNKALHAFLLRLSFLFGWRGFHDSFPLHMYPMAIMTFATGLPLAWADLLYRELVYDVRRRRRCPRLVRVWSVIWQAASQGSNGPALDEGPELRHIYESYLQRCLRLDEPFLWAYPYRMGDISPWTPPVVRAVVLAGAMY